MFDELNQHSSLSLFFLMPGIWCTDTKECIRWVDFSQFQLCRLELMQDLRPCSLIINKYAPSTVWITKDDNALWVAKVAEGPCKWLSTPITGMLLLCHTPSRRDRLNNPLYPLLSFSPSFFPSRPFRLQPSCLQEWPAVSARPHPFIIGWFILCASNTWCGGYDVRTKLYTF